MKKMFIIISLFLPYVLFAQEKKARDLIKKHLYIKVSPTLLYGDGLFTDYDNNKSTAILGAVGAKIRYAALGFSIGHIHFRDAGNATPWGADLTITDFKRKIFPVIIAQWHKVEYSKFYYAPGSGFHYHTIYGKDMQTIGAGVAFTVFKRLKLMATMGVSRLNYKLKTYWSPRDNESYTNYFKRHENMPFIAASVVL